MDERLNFDHRVVSFGTMRFALSFILCLGFAVVGRSDPARQLTGPELIAGAKGARPKGGVYVRARLVQGKTVMQMQIKRRSLPNGGTDQLYQLSYPKDRLGESLLLHVNGGTFTGSFFKPGAPVRKLTGADRRQGVFGTDLTIEDLLADFLDWKHQVITGHETLGVVPCAVIESKPDRASQGKGPSKTLSWIDEKRYVPMRVQVFDGGEEPARVVTTDKVIRTSNGYYMPATFTVKNVATGSETQVDGSSSKSEIPYTDADFTELAMQQLTPPPAAP